MRSPRLRLPCAIILAAMALTLPGWGSFPAPARAADAPLTLALTPSRDPTALQEAGDAFVRTITRLSGVPMRAQVASDYAGVVEALRSRRVDLAFVHPVGYVLANREAGCLILVLDIWQGKTAYTARFYVRGGIYTTVVAEHAKPNWKMSALPDLDEAPAPGSVR